MNSRSLSSRFRSDRRVSAWFALLLASAVWPVYGAATLRVSSIQSNGWLRISGTGVVNAAITLNASSNFTDWKTIALLHGNGFEFTDPVSAELPNRFYRFSAVPLTATNDWKNQVSIPDGFFDVSGADAWVKFAIVTNEPARVYYADGREYLLHYDFATARLEPLYGLSPDEFEQVALYNEGRKVILGAVLYPAAVTAREYGIQFVSRDPLPPELVRDLFELVKSTVITPEAYRAFYMPSFEQFQTTEANRGWFESNNIPIGSTGRWADDNTCYALGWAIGRLNFITATNIEAAYSDGRLLPSDILLTDGVPSELPYVAGIITLAPSTPNSHVAILARSYGIPFVHLLGPGERERALQLIGREIALQLYNRDNELSPCSVDISALDATFDPTLKAELLNLKNAAPINITPMTHFGAYTSPTARLYPSNICHFGGKAANYGLLRRTISSNAAFGIAISFDLWNEFMAQTLPNGKTLRQEINERLAGYKYPSDIGPIKTALSSIRTLIRQNTQFTPGQHHAITNALWIFDSRRNIRFRSSTNVEDTESFTGAGLYDSYSGCLMDEHDGDNAGPSHCDPTEDDERGVFRAIRRVYASFYNDNAYLERLRHGVDESVVGMAMLVHYSTPDDIEMANGVATVTSEPDGVTLKADLVTQIGATSVANPDGSAAPEVVEATRFSTNNPPLLRLVQPSSLIPYGEHVMEWDSDYRGMCGLLFKVTDAYRRMMGKQGKFLLDFEYKKVEPDWLDVKQVREIPLSPANTATQQYLLNDNVVVVPYQGLDIDIFATHRLKSKWTLRTKNLPLTQSNLASTAYTELTIEHLNDGRVETLSGPIESFPDFAHSFGEGFTIETWRMPTLAGPASVALGTRFPSLKLLQTAGAAVLTLVAHYDYPVPIDRLPGTRTNDSAILTVMRHPDPMPRDEQQLQTGTFSEGGTNITISVVFTLGVHLDEVLPRSLIGTPQTRIEGLTSQPIVLTNYYSQTVGVYHLGSGEKFLLEPRLEPGIPPSVLSELDALNIRLLLFNRSPQSGNSLRLMDRNGNLRRFGAPN